LHFSHIFFVKITTGSLCPIHCSWSFSNPILKFSFVLPPPLLCWICIPLASFFRRRYYFDLLTDGFKKVHVPSSGMLFHFFIVRYDMTPLHISFLYVFLISTKSPVRRSIYHALCSVGPSLVIFFSTVISLIN
jgi:hypothetical protein